MLTQEQQIKRRSVNQDELVEIATLRVIADYQVRTGQAPPQRTLFGKGVADGGLFEAFWTGVREYADYPYPDGLRPGEVYSFRLQGGDSITRITNSLAERGMIIARGDMAESRRRKPYLATETGIAFAQALPTDWHDWQWG